MIPSERSHLPVAAFTHPGMKGKNNEDRYAVSAFRLSQNKSTQVLWMIIADGVGGHLAGELAAEMAVEIISREMAAGDPAHPIDTLRTAIQRAGSEISARAVSDTRAEGMSTTCVCAWVIGDRLYAAWVGDSRLYLIRHGKALRLTTDHTWVQEAVEKGIITLDQARNHPNAHVLRRHLGSQNGVEPDFRIRTDPEQSDSQAEANQGLRLHPGDRLILCSDGLTDLVEDEEILERLRDKTLDEALPELINLANERGGHDNITVVGLQVPASRMRSPFGWGMGGLVFLLLLALVWFGANAWIDSRLIEQVTATPSLLPLQQPVIVSTDPFPQPLATTTPTAFQPTATTPPPPEATLTIPVMVGTQATYTPWPTSTSLGGSPLP
ncbi:MAG TPA: PP2C family serine/threonine-protein phosphatase [Anaerolineales bacterium]|nr:PP2C family serine/threonine-protein phosphatase [Anaerolineales bacterium]